MIKHYSGQGVILPIKYREQGIKPKAHKPVVASDGFRTIYKDGTVTTCTPYVTLNEWQKQGSKYAPIHKKRVSKTAV